MERQIAYFLVNNHDLKQVIAGFLESGSRPFDLSSNKKPDALLRFCEKRHPDVLLLEWEALTATENAQFLQKFRKAPGCRGTALIVITQNLNSQLVAMGAEYNVSKILNASAIQSSILMIIEALIQERKKPSSSKSFIMRLDTAIETGAMGELQELVEDFYKVCPSHPRAIIEYANICFKKGNIEKAKEIGNKLLANEPHNLRAVNLMGRIFLKEGKFAESIAMLEQAELLSPKNLDRLVLLGDAFYNTGDNSKAREHFDDALQIDPEFKDAKKGLGQVNLSEGQINEALELFRDSASEDEMGGFFNNTAIVAVRMQNYDRAMQLYNAANGALTEKNLKAKVKFNQGLAFRRWNRLENAYICFKQALSFEPEHEKALKYIDSTASLLTDMGKPLPQENSLIAEQSPFQFETSLPEESGINYEKLSKTEIKIKKQDVFAPIESSKNKKPSAKTNRQAFFDDDDES